MDNFKFYKLAKIACYATLVFFYYFIFSCKNEIKFPESCLKFSQENEKIDLSSVECIALIFSPNDCSTCVNDIITILNDVSDYTKDNTIQIVGILNTKYKQAVNKVRYNYGINFTLLQDSSLTTKKLFSESSFLVEKPILVHLQYGKVIRKGIVGEPGDQKGIKEIFKHLKKRN